MLETSMQKEFQSLQDNLIWDIVPCPNGVKLLCCKWVYTRKLQLDGSIARYQVCLLALRNWQEYGFDYEEMFAFVAKMTTLHTVMTIAALKWSTQHMDMVNIFLHGDLKQEIYNSFSWHTTHSSSKVCCLKQMVIYGLK